MQNKILVLFAFCISFQQNHSFAQHNKPNIIYIMSDDLGYADLSCYGRKDYSTPNLDGLARQGVKFINAYAAAPVCTPSRAAFMTGKYPAKTSVGLSEPLMWTHEDSLIGLTADQTSVATFLRHAGYETILIGKWHLGFKPEFGPNENGFDEFFGFHGGAIDYISHNNENGNPELYEDGNPVKADGYLTDIFTDSAIQFINRKHTKPFFLTLTFNAPHFPWQGPQSKAYPDTMNTSDGGSVVIYGEMVESLDAAVGRILKALDDTNLLDSTVVIFTSDNGGEKYSDMGPYAGQKSQLWEGGLRVPAFIKWHGIIPENKISAEPIITMDWTATILAIAGVKPDPKSPLDGENLMPLCTGKKAEYDRTLYWRTFQRWQQEAMRDGKWKYLKIEQQEYLFDLSVDPGEKNNLKNKFVTVFNHLKTKYKKWEGTVLKPVP